MEKDAADRGGRSHVARSVGAISERSKSSEKLEGTSQAREPLHTTRGRRFELDAVRES